MKIQLKRRDFGNIQKSPVNLLTVENLRQTKGHEWKKGTITKQFDEIFTIVWEFMNNLEQQLSNFALSSSFTESSLISTLSGPSFELKSNALKTWCCVA